MVTLKSSKRFENASQVFFKLVYLAFAESSVIEVDHIERDTFIGRLHFFVLFCQLDQRHTPVLVWKCPDDMPGLLKLVQHASQSGFPNRCPFGQFLYRNAAFLPQGKQNSPLCRIDVGDPALLEFPGKMRPDNWWIFAIKNPP